ncbi:MAG: TRAP transporter small permease [Burkholderiaceae bacterium]
MAWLKSYRAFTSFLGTVVGLCFGAIAVLIPLDMLLRGTGAGSMPWLSEVVEYSIFAGVFLAAPWVLAENGHVRVDLLSAALSPAQARRLEIGLAILGFSICLAFIGIAIAGTLDAFEFGAVIRRSLAVPEWWLLGLFVVAMSLMAVEFLIRVRLIWSGGLSELTAHTDGF